MGIFMRFYLFLCAIIIASVTSAPVKADLFLKKKAPVNAEEEVLRGEEKAPEDVPAEEKKTPKQVFVPKKSKNPSLTPQEMDRIVVMHTQEIGAYCVGSWQSQNCMKALSSSALTLASLYAEKLEKAGHKDAQDPLLQNCAAATAATKVEVPAYAMKSALTTCANAIYDITESTKIKPNLTHFQLLVEPIYCLGGDPRCEKLEEILRAVVAKSMTEEQKQPQQ
jgi:hypothetical protein